MLSVHSFAALSRMDHNNPEMLKDPGGEPGLTAGDVRRHTLTNVLYISVRNIGQWHSVSLCFYIAAHWI